MRRNRTAFSRGHVLLLTALCSVVVAAVLPAVVVAADAQAAGLSSDALSSVSLRVAGYALDSRDVHLRVDGIPAGASAIAVRLAGVEATRVPVAAGQYAKTFPLAIPSSVTEQWRTADVSATVLGPDDAVIASSPDLHIDTFKFIPVYPKLSVKSDQLVLPSQSIGVSTGGATRIAAWFAGRACWTTCTVEGSSWRVRLPNLATMSRCELRVHVYNAWGVRAIRIPVWSLRWRPSTYRSILVDKSDFLLYYAESSRMHLVYPVAIGMPGTPTRTGSFWLGAPRPASGAWGVLRMALSKTKGTGYLPSWGGYYIHGTNQPDTIGTEASHGCVRLFNWSVVNLSKHTSHRLTSVTIRP